MGDFVRDLQYGFRQLLRRPGFSATAIVSLALGIGLNTTLFSVVNGVLFRGGSVSNPDELVEIYSGLLKGFPQLTTSYPDYLELRDGVEALSGLAASSYARGILTTGARSTLVTGEVVSANYFGVLGVGVPIGRAFRDEENVSPGAHPVAVLSHGLWQQRFGGRDSVVGETIKLSGLEYSVIGVAPPDFTGTIPGLPTEFWTPLMMVESLQFSGVQATTGDEPGLTRIERRGTRWLFLKGRLAPGRTVAQVRAQAETIYSRLRTDHPVTNKDVTVDVVPAASIRFHPMLDGYVRAASAGLLAAVGLILLISCANVANMLLARGASRQREFAIRAAVGASRRRIVSQLLSEGLVLAVAGGAVGVLAAWWAGQALSGLGTSVFPIPVQFDFSLDRSVLAFALGISMATAVIFGLAPAWSSSRPELVPGLKASAEGDSRGSALRNVLVVGQLSLSLILLVGGALLARGLLTAQNANLGFDPQPISSLSFNLQMNGYDVERATAFRDRAFQTLRALPGVTAVSTASRLPLSPDINMDGILVADHDAPDADPTPIDAVRVGTDYFTVVGVPIVSGRAFTEDDVANGRRVAVVNETFARKYWPDQAAVGQRIHPDGFDKDSLEVVGVSRDHRVRSVGEDPRPYLHVPSQPSRTVGLVVRTSAPSVAALPALRQAILSLDSEILFTEETSAGEVAATTVAPTRIGAMVFAAFGLLALLLAAVGLYGVIAYSVGRRTREIGVRIALGAGRGEVLRMVLAQGGRLALVGIAIGTIGAAAVARVLESLLYGVSGFDPVAYGAAAGMMLLVACLANLLPALAAARVDPVRALRSE